jgi:putative redox protein
MCKVATVRYIQKINGKLEVDANEKRKRRKLKTKHHVTAKIKIEGELTQNKRELLKQADACYVHRMIEGEWI